MQKSLNYKHDKKLAEFLLSLDKASASYTVEGKIIVHYPKTSFTDLEGGDLLDLMEQVKEIFPRTRIPFREKITSYGKYSWWEIPVDPASSSGTRRLDTKYSVSFA